MLIRRISDDDIDQWLRMRSLLWPGHPEQGHLQEMAELAADPLSAVFAAVRPDGSLGGFLEASQRKYADGCETSPVGYIEGWYIDHDLRQQGVGRLLVQAAEEWARGLGLKEMASDCLIDNLESYAAHTALGYQEVERQVHFKKGL